MRCRERHHHRLAQVLPRRVVIAVEDGLHRFADEGANVVVARNGHVVAYMGDDERFDYMYKFVSDEMSKPGNSKHASKPRARPIRFIRVSTTTVSNPITLGFLYRNRNLEHKLAALS